MLTGYGHEKLNTLHRWPGWIMFIMSSLHTVPFFLQETRERIVKSKFYTPGAYEVGYCPIQGCLFEVANLTSTDSTLELLVMPSALLW
jgi:hypothetical protein